MAMQNYGGIMRDLDAECATWNARQVEYRKASEHQQRQRIERVCARYELESDEFQSAEQKARALIASANLA